MTVDIVEEDSNIDDSITERDDVAEESITDVSLPETKVLDVVSVSEDSKDEIIIDDVLTGEEVITDGSNEYSDVITDVEVSTEYDCDILSELVNDEDGKSVWLDGIIDSSIEEDEMISEDDIWIEDCTEVLSLVENTALTSEAEDTASELIALEDTVSDDDSTVGILDIKVDVELNTAEEEGNISDVGYILDETESPDVEVDSNILEEISDDRGVEVIADEGIKLVDSMVFVEVSICSKRLKDNCLVKVKEW